MKQIIERKPGDAPMTGMVTSESSPRFRRRAITVSIMVHAGLLVALLCWYIPHRESKPSQASSVPTGNDGQSSNPSGYSTAPVSNPKIPAAQIQSSLKSTLEQIDNLPDEQKLTELEKNLRRLNAISDPESVVQTSHVIADALQLVPGPMPLEENPTGSFDSETAQIHDVIRARNDKGNWTYKSVLVDSDGRTQTVAMPLVEGETTYNTFQQMKKYPMAAGIYRQLVMPMLQKMIAAMDVAEREALKTGRDQNDGNTDRLPDPIGSLPSDEQDAASAER